MIDKPTKRFLSDEDKLLNGLDIKGRKAIKKAIEIKNILLINSPNDKTFNEKSILYLIEFITILNKLDITDNKDYSDEEIQRDINKLYEKIFKNRRY